MIILLCFPSFCARKTYWPGLIPPPLLLNIH
jgi:hypothetical protein